MCDACSGPYTDYLCFLFLSKTDTTRLEYFLGTIVCFFFQICSLRFGSWAFDGGELDMVVDHSETGVKKGTYQNNTEWEMMKVTVERKEVSIKMFCL